MNILKNKINFFIWLFLITDLWIILYINLVDFFNFTHPPRLTEIFFRSPIANPEPYEIPLYLFLTSIFIFFIWFFKRNSSFISVRLPSLANNDLIQFIVKIITIGFLLWLFLNKLGPFNLAHNPHPFLPRPNRTFYDLGIMLYLFIIVVINIEVGIINRLIKSKKIVFILGCFFVTLIGALITFEPRFPISGEHALFLGPIWEVAQGKTIYTQIPSQYAFLPILLFSVLVHFNLHSLSLLSIFIWVLWIIEFVLSFYLLYKVSKSLPFAFIGTQSIITIQYLSYYQTAQTGPFRWLPILIGIVLFNRFKKIDAKPLIFSVALLGLWFIDSGMEMILSYFATLFMFFLVKVIDFKRLLTACLFFFLSYAAIISSINITHMLIGMRPIDWIDMFLSLKKHAQVGLTLYPMQAINFFWIVILIYYATILFFFTRKKPDSSNQLLLFSANASLFASLYYIGRSVEQNLFPISIFALLTLFFLINNLFYRLQSPKNRLIFLILFFIGFVAIPAYNRQEFISETFFVRYQRLIKGEIFKPDIDEILWKKYGKEIQLIKNNLKEKQIAVLSPDDTFLLILSGKKNLLDVNPQSAIDTVSEMNFAIKRATVKCPKKIAVDCTIFDKCLSHEFYSRFFNISPFILTNIEKSCKVSYKPIECTNQLCIAQSTKIN